MGDALRVHIEGPAQERIERIDLPCTSQCVQVAAVVSGGQPPYHYAWSDGTTAPQHAVCRDTSGPLKVTVSDTGVSSAEFGSPATSAEVTLQTGAVDCDPRMPDAGMPSQVKQCEPYTGSPCDLGGGVQLPDDVTVDVLGSLRFFAKGAVLPAGRYRLSYVDGCNTYGVGGGWTIHALDGAGDLASCNVVDENGGHVARAPGTTGILAGENAAFETYEACVAANCRVPPVDFDFAGGKLAAHRDGVLIGSVDDSGGEDVGGRSPTFRLTSLDHCR